MRRFLVQLSAFFLPLMLAAFGIEFALRRIPNEYNYKREYLDAHARAINTLILGSSHSFAGLDPVYFSRNAFNAANGSQTLVFDYQILKKYEHNFEGLRTVVVPVSYFTFYYDLARGIEPWRIMDYVLYFHLPVARRYKDYSEVLSHNVNYNVIRLARHVFRRDRTDRGLNCTSLGRRRDTSPPQELVGAGRARARFHTVDDVHSAKNTALFNANRAVFDSIIHWGKKRSVRIVFFTPPAYESYRRNLNPEQLRMTVETARGRARENDNCVYVNLLDDPAFTASDFHDPDHLSDAGARKLSIIIDSLLEKNSQTPT